MAPTGWLLPAGSYRLAPTGWLLLGGRLAILPIAPLLLAKFGRYCLQNSAGLLAKFGRIVVVTLPFLVIGNLKRCPLGFPNSNTS